MRRDSHVSKVYQWEYHINACGAVPREVYWDRSLPDLNDWLDALWQVEYKRAGIGEFPSPVVVMKKRNAVHADTDMEARHIRLPSNLKCKYVLLHELAHLLTPNAVNEKGGWHGPAFVGVLIHLLKTYCGADENRMLAEAARRRVPVRVL